MYIEEIVTTRNGKEYRTTLVRESFREGSKVSHRTIANISHLPRGCIEEISRYLKGNSGNLDFSQVQVLDSKEYGASQSTLSVAKKIGLDKLIHPHNLKWRKDVLALIVAKLVYPRNGLVLTRVFSDTVLAESFSHSLHKQGKHCPPCCNTLNQLLSKQIFIQKKLTDKHLKKESIALLFLASTMVKEELEWTEVTHFHQKDPVNNFKEFCTLLVTSCEGCPLAVQSFPITNNDQNHFQEQIKKIKDQLRLHFLILVGDGQMLEKVVNKDFDTISGLSATKLRSFVEDRIISPNLFSKERFGEFSDPTNSSIRYVLCLNVERKNEQARCREELIKKTKALLRKVQKQNQNIFVEIQKIWDTFKTEKFFHWHIEDGQLIFSVNKGQVLQEELLDGCYGHCTNIRKEMLSAREVVHIYQNLNQVYHMFGLIQVSAPETSHLPLEEQVQSRVFLTMLAYYLQWHMSKKLNSVHKREGEITTRRWTFNEVIERLKSIRSQTIKIGNLTIENVKSTLDNEQREMISALGVTLSAKFPLSND